jgi:hypothetical protein
MKPIAVTSTESVSSGYGEKLSAMNVNVLFATSSLQGGAYGSGQATEQLLA